LHSRIRNGDHAQARCIVVELYLNPISCVCPVLDPSTDIIETKNTGS
jgi:hypothetical protein